MVVVYCQALRLPLETWRCTAFATTVVPPFGPLGPVVSYPVPSLGLAVVGIAVDCCTLTVVEMECPVGGGCTGVDAGPEGPAPPIVDP